MWCNVSELLLKQTLFGIINIKMCAKKINVNNLVNILQF